MNKQNNENADGESRQVEQIVIPPICWKCKKPLMKKLCKDEIGGNFEYETFRYKAMDGTIKTNYCCLICQMEVAV